MSKKVVIIIFLVFMNLYGCSGTGEEYGYKSSHELKNAYQEFQKSKNIDGLLSLVYSKSGNKDFHLMSFEEDIQYQVKSILIEDLKDGDLDEWKKRGIEPNIDPVGWLKVSFQHTDKKDPGMSYSSTSQYLIGKKDGGYYFATNE